MSSTRRAIKQQENPSSGLHVVVEALEGMEVAASFVDRGDRGRPRVSRSVFLLQFYISSVSTLCVVDGW